VADSADRITRYMALEIVRRVGFEAAMVEPGRMGPIGAERASSSAAMGVVIAAFAIGILTGAAGLVVAVLLSAP
jgi:hypothetical protein